MSNRRPEADFDLSPPPWHRQNDPPWRFERYIYGLRNVVLTSLGTVLATHVPTRSGALLAAAPSLLAVVEKISNLPEDTEARRIAIRALTRFRAREAEALQDADPSYYGPSRSLFRNIRVCS